MYDVWFASRKYLSRLVSSCRLWVVLPGSFAQTGRIGITDAIGKLAWIDMQEAGSEESEDLGVTAKFVY